MKFKLLFAVDESRFFVISQFAKSLEKKGIECKIIDDLDIYDSKYSNRKYLRWLKKSEKLQSVLDEFKPDAVFTERVSHLSSLILKQKIPLIIFLRGDYWSEVKWAKETLGKKTNEQLEVWVKGKVAEKCFSESTLILPICKYLGKIVTKRYPEKNIQILYQGIDTKDWFETQDMKLKHPCVGLVQGATIWEKTKELLILPKILEELPDVHFYWAGDGIYRNEVLPILEKFENFHWIGAIDYPDKVREFLSEIDVYALISGIDMSPHTILEASLMKKPILATDIGGVSESITKENGFLIKKGEPSEWIKKISLLIRDEHMIDEMGKKSHEYVKNNFIWDKIAEDFVNILKEKTNLIKE